MLAFTSTAVIMLCLRGNNTMINLQATSLPQTQWLETYLKVCEVGNYQQAADDLNISKASVSLHIKSLEGITGYKLFKRARRGQSLVTTDAGEFYLRRVQKIVSTLYHNYIDDNSPSIQNQPIKDAHPDFKELLKKLEETSFHLEPGERTHGILSRNITFRMINGKWIFNSIGRLSSFGRLVGPKMSENLIGFPSDTNYPAGNYNAYNYSVTKAYNLAHFTKEPGLSAVDTYIIDQNSNQSLRRYQRLVVPVTDPHGDLILVGVIRDYPEHAAFMDQPQSSLIDPINLPRIDSHGTMVKYLYQWYKHKLIFSSPLSQFLDDVVIYRPLPPERKLIAIHIGCKHEFVKLLGDEWRLNNTGQIFCASQSGTNYDRRLFSSYLDILEHGEPQLTRVVSRRRLDNDQIHFITYFRLACRVYLEDGSEAIAQIASKAERFNNHEDALAYGAEYLT